MKMNLKSTALINLKNSYLKNICKFLVQEEVIIALENEDICPTNEFYDRLVLQVALGVLKIVLLIRIIHKYLQLDLGIMRLPTG